MSIQAQLYIEEMKNMYKKIMAKTELTPNDIEFLNIYKKTIDDMHKKESSNERPS